MLEEIREILPLALGVAISPIPIAAIIFVLMTRRGLRNGSAFVIGWILGLLLLVGGVAVLIRSLHDPGKHDAGLVIPLVRVGLGLFLLVLSARYWWKRPRRGEVPGAPGWMKALDQFSFSKALILGAVLVTLNVKNLPISISAAAVLARHQSAPADFIVTLLVFTFIASAGVTAPVIVTRLGGEKSDLVLQGWKRWLRVHNASILCGLFLIIGLAALIKGVVAFL